MMREQVGHLNGMVGELRDLIHLLLSRDLVLQTESAAPADIVAEALAVFRREYGPSQISRASTDLPADLPRVLCAPGGPHGL